MKFVSKGTLMNEFRKTDPIVTENYENTSSIASMLSTIKQRIPANTFLINKSVDAQNLSTKPYEVSFIIQSSSFAER